MSDVALPPTLGTLVYFIMQWTQSHWSSLEWQSVKLSFKIYHNVLITVGRWGDCFKKWMITENPVSQFIYLCHKWKHLITSLSIAIYSLTSQKSPSATLYKQWQWKNTIKGEIIIMEVTSKYPYLCNQQCQEISSTPRNIISSDRNTEM